jgi:hypothetical protein
MTYKRFKKITQSLQRQDDELSKLYKLRVDLIDFMDPYQVIVKELMTEIYGEQGYDWFSWFCYESDYGKKDWNLIPTIGADGVVIPKADKSGAHDENGDPICYDMKSTWAYLEGLMK